MTAKKWLGRARFIDREIETLERTKEETRDRLLKITQSYEFKEAQTTPDPHKYDKLVEIDDQIDQKKNELVRTKAEIIAVIYFLDDAMQRITVFDYYVRGMPLQDIAHEIKYSYRQTRRFHNFGVANIEKFLKKEGILS